jgi:hypothetical protein
LSGGGYAESITECQVHLSTVESAKVKGLLVRLVQLSTFGTASPRFPSAPRVAPTVPQAGRKLTGIGPGRADETTIVDKSYTRMISLWSCNAFCCSQMGRSRYGGGRRCTTIVLAASTQVRTNGSP